ncbi:MAG: hypothetical protein Q9M31_03405 [Mariprofundus sp.]|nr:hypothetical protein [Mariprofundus sp.]
MRVIRYICMAVLVGSFFSTAVCLADENQYSTIGASDDCSDVSVHFAASASMTKQERIKRMDEALRSSLNKYERCARQQERSSTVNDGVKANGQGDGQMDVGDGLVNSEASTTMAGTDNTAVEKTLDTQVTQKRTAPVKGGARQTKGEKILANGKVPGDIPKVNNDSVLEEQIRMAAINETDPVIKEKLWNEYRRYKGLPAVHTLKGQ